MARHNLFTLDSETAAHAARMAETLHAAQEAGVPVSLVVRSRETGESSAREGTVVGFSGVPGMSSDSVTIETDRGFRTFNVWLIGTVGF